MPTARRYELNKARLLHLLEELKASSLDVGSLCVPPGSSKAEIDSLVAGMLGNEPVPDDLPTALVESETGGIVFWGPYHRYLVMPPFPVPALRRVEGARGGFSKTCEIEPLYSLMHQELMLGLVIVRLGEYGIGVFQGEKLLGSKTGTGLVHARHRAGGSSANRFRRHREKQMETFFTRVCEHAREQLEPYARKFDYVLYGGTRETVLDFRKQCHFTRELDKVTLNRLLNIKNPKKSGLEEGFQEAWSSKVIRWE